MQKQGRGKAGGEDKGKAGDDAEAESKETKLLCAVGDTCEICGACNTIIRSDALCAVSRNTAARNARRGPQRLL